MSMQIKDFLYQLYNYGKLDATLLTTDQKQPKKFGKSHAVQPGLKKCVIAAYSLIYQQARRSKKRICFVQSTPSEKFHRAF